MDHMAREPNPGQPYLEALPRSRRSFADLPLRVRFDAANAKPGSKGSDLIKQERPWWAENLYPTDTLTSFKFNHTNRVEKHLT